MINKETLLKKIENEETVWLIGADVIEWKLKKGDYVNGGYRRGGIFQPFDSIFATKEEAEWELEFGNITRTEKLELPTWEKAKNGDLYWGFTGRDRTGYILRTFSGFGCGWTIGFICVKDIKDKAIFEVPLTKENYIKACRLCKKLFLEGAEK